jgi:hypothetical protein
VAVFNTCQSTCDVSRFTPLRSFRNQKMEMTRTPTTRVTKSRNAKSRKCLMHKAMVTALGHISERWRKELEQPSLFSGIATWRGKNSMQQECRNHDMRNRDSIAAVESRSDLEHRVIGHVESD